MDYNGIKEWIIMHCWKIWRTWKMLEVSEFLNVSRYSLCRNSPRPDRPASFSRHKHCADALHEASVHASCQPIPQATESAAKSLEIEPYLAMLSHVRLHFWTYLDIVLLALGAHWWDVTSKRTNAAVNNYSCQRLTLMPGWNIWNYSKTYEDGKCMAQGNLVRMVFGKTFSIARSTWKRAESKWPANMHAFRKILQNVVPKCSETVSAMTAIAMAPSCTTPQ